MSKKLREAINEETAKLLKKQRKESEDWVNEQIAKMREQETVKYCLNYSQEFSSSDPDRLLCFDCSPEGKDHAT